MPTNIKNYYCKHICHSQKKINLEIGKNTRDFLKFPPNTLLLTMDFYNDEEIEGIRKLLLDLEIKLNIFDQNKTTQCIFWYMLFNFMTPTNCEIKLTTARRKLLSEKY